MTRIPCAKVKWKNIYISDEPIMSKIAQRTVFMLLLKETDAPGSPRALPKVSQLGVGHFDLNLFVFLTPNPMTFPQCSC